MGGDWCSVLLLWEGNIEKKFSKTKNCQEETWERRRKAKKFWVLEVDDQWAEWKMEGIMAINKGKRKRIDSGTSVTVKFSPWTIMTAVWTRSKLDPVTSMFRPPLKRKYTTYTYIQQCSKTCQSRYPRPYKDKLIGRATGRQAQFFHCTWGNFHRRWKQISLACEVPICCSGPRS